MPRHNRNNVSEPTDESMVNARSYMTLRERELYDYFSAIYTDCAMTPFRHSRTESQRHNMTMVSDWQTWDNVITEFQSNVELYKFLSLDIEGFHELEDDPNDWRFKRRLTYLILGDLTGQVLILDMDRLHSRVGDNACGNEPLVSVPRVVFQWLRQERIVVVGSDVVGDCSKYGIPATSLVDSREVFKHYQSSHGSDTALVNIGSSSRSGLGAQFYYCKKFDNKTMPPSKFRKLYGRIQYRNSDGTPFWPELRLATNLFRWEKDEQGMLDEHALHYLFHDGSAGASLIARLAIDLLTKFRIQVSQDTLVTDVITTIVGPFMVNSEHDFDVSSPNLPQLSVDVPSVIGRVEDEVGTVEVAPAPPQDDDSMQDDVEVLDKPRRTLRGTSFSFFKPNQRRLNPYKAVPLFDRVCFACGEPGHSRRNHKGGLLCPREISEPATLICTYRACHNRVGHLVAVCPTMHHRCLACAHRGHLESANCSKWSSAQWQAAWEDFESSADEGHWTSKRKGDDRWGFHTHLFKQAGYPFDETHTQLLRRSVEYLDYERGLRPRENLYSDMFCREYLSKKDPPRALRSRRLTAETRKEPNSRLRTHPSYGRRSR